jgi:hypothetical protein
VGKLGFCFPLRIQVSPVGPVDFLFKKLLGLGYRDSELIGEGLA